MIKLFSPEKRTKKQIHRPRLKKLILPLKKQVGQGHGFKKIFVRLVAELGGIPTVGKTFLIVQQEFNTGATSNRLSIEELLKLIQGS